MNTDKNKNLDEQITNAIGRDGLKFDFNKWKDEHKEEVQIYKSQTTGQENKSARIYRIGNIIMKSKITKFSAAAAVLIVFVSMLYLPGNSGKVYGMSDLPKLFYSADTIHIKSRMYFPEVKDLKNISVDLEYWLDLKSGRWRTTYPGLTGGPNGIEVALSEDVCDGNDFSMRIDHNTKQVTFSKISKFQRILFNQVNIYSIMQMICSNPEGFQEFIEKREDIIEGRTYQVWEAEVPQVNNSIDIKIQSWLSPKTGDFAKVIIWTKNPAKVWRKKMEIYLIERNTSLSDKIFSMQIPAGYTTINTKETAKISPLISAEGGYDNYHLWIHGLFMMPDGSFVLCWSSEDTKSNISQEDLFKVLKIRSEFPKLPFQIDALQTSFKGETITLAGYHLAYTRKNNKYYEWGIYIPQKQLKPEYSQLLSYDIIYSDNIKNPDNKNSFSISIGNPIWIRDNQKFNDIFSGAIEELSDDGKLLDDLSLETLMDLSEQIHKENK